MMTRRRFLRGAGVAAGLAAGAGFYAWKVEPHWLEVSYRQLSFPQLPAEANGLSVVHLSDLHIGARVSDAYLYRAFDAVRALRPDIVVYTGDFISYQSDDDAHAGRVMSKLPLGTLGTFGSLGNHDYGPGWSQLEVANRIADLAESAGVKILRNECAQVRGISIVGLDELWAGQFSLQTALDGLPAKSAAIALSHNPDTADLTGWETFSGWVLSGHTHGGQCKPPFLPPPLLPVKNRRYTSGEFQLSESRRLYISRGIGHLIPVRFNARPEIATFRLTSNLQPG